jgi:hypothetical protein
VRCCSCGLQGARLLPLMLHCNAQLCMLPLMS